MSDDLAPKTHNNPPDELELLVQQLTEDNTDMVGRSDDLRKVAERNRDLVLADPERASKVSDEIARVKAALDELDQRREAAKAPLIARTRAIEGFYQNRMAPLNAILTLWKNKLRDWQVELDRREAERRRQEAEEARRRQEEARREREAAEKAEDDRRRAAEEAERKAAKARSEAARAAAEERAAAARQAAEDAERAARQARQQEVSTEMVASHTQAQVERGDTARAARVRGDRGSVSSLRKTFSYRITDEDRLPRRYLMPDDQGIRRAINGRSRVTEIPGIEIFEEANTQTKRK